MSSSEMSCSPSPPSVSTSVVLVVLTAIGRHERVRRPGACTFDAACVAPARGKSFEDLVKLFPAIASHEERSLPFQAALPTTDFTGERAIDRSEERRVGKESISPDAWYQL